MVNVRDILNRARWATGDLHTLAITVVHRGAPNDQRTLSGARVIAVQGGGIELSADEPEAETAFVPYHRFVAVHAADGALLWDRHGHAVAPVRVETQVASVEVEAREITPTFDVVLPGAELTLDGSAGEGGGQILRSALALSMITGRAFVLDRIRAGRKKPGLMRQHLTCVRAAAQLCSAEVEGAELRSGRLRFVPGPITGGDFDFDVGSAGSTSLVLQTIALPMLKARCRVRVRGGTHVMWSPIQPFLEHAWLPPVQLAGAQLTLEMVSAGFNPAAGGEVVMTSEPSSLAPLHLAPSVGPYELSLHAIVSNLPEGIARRELISAAELLNGEAVQLHSGTVRSPGPGNALWLVARDVVTGLSNVFSALGERGLGAEDVGAQCVRAFSAWRASGASVEEHLADQLMLPIALAGEGSYTCSELSLHSRTNIEVIHAFTGTRLRAWEIEGGGARVGLTR